MGNITSLIKSSASNSFNQLKSYDYKGKINQALDMSGIDLQIPDLEVPEQIKNFKPNFNTKDLKLPAGLGTYLSPIESTILNNVKLPAEIGGVKLPELPDLSSVTSKVDEYLSGMGFDTEKLGIRSVEDILKTPDLSALNGGSLANLTNITSLPDITNSFDMNSITSATDSFDMGSLQSQIDEMTKDMPGMESIDLSQYF